MSAMNQLREGLHEAWDNLVDGWNRFYRRASGAMTRYTPGKKGQGEASSDQQQEILLRNAGWGVLAAEVFDDDEDIVMRVEAPGMDKSDFDLKVMDDYVVIRGEKRLERERSKGRYHMTECAYGRFERVIPLPDKVESGKAQASYRNGVLRIELPKADPRLRKTIKVDVR